MSYDDYPETEKCYLDGWYFNQVLGDIGEISLNKGQPISIKLMTHSESVSFPVWDISTHNLVVSRIVIEDHRDRYRRRHTNSIVIDHEKQEIYRLEPLENVASNIAYQARINSQMQKVYDGLGIGNYNPVLLTRMFKPAARPIGCDEYGYCVAEAIWFTLEVIDVTEARELDQLRYVSYLESIYGLPPGAPDISYGWTPILVGGLGGAAVGGLLGGGLTGVAVGGAIGALGGLAYNAIKNKPK